MRIQRPSVKTRNRWNGGPPPGPSDLKGLYREDQWTVIVICNIWFSSKSHRILARYFTESCIADHSTDITTTITSASVADAPGQ